MERQRWWSKTLLIGSIVAAVLLPVGALGTKLGVWSFGIGFRFLMVSVVVAAVGLVAGIVAIPIAHARRLAADRRASVLGTVVSGLILAVMVVQAGPAFSVPPIHNISTDRLDPPAFDAIVALRGEQANPLAYDAEKLADLQLRAYPEVQTLRSGLSPAASFERAVAALEDMGLEVVNADAARGIVEATDETFWFGFKDDVVVRLRGSAQGTDVDVRSVSRVGQSDLGVNARRIVEFLERFQAG